MSFVGSCICPNFLENVLIKRNRAVVQSLCVIVSVISEIKPGFILFSITRHRKLDSSTSICSLPNPRVSIQRLWLVVQVRGMKGIFIVNQQTSDKHIKTFITFDQGGAWRTIPAPASCKQVRNTNIVHLHRHIHSLTFTTTSEHREYQKDANFAVNIKTS